MKYDEFLYNEGLQDGLLGAGEYIESPVNKTKVAEVAKQSYNLRLLDGELLLELNMELL